MQDAISSDPEHSLVSSSQNSFNGCNHFVVPIFADGNPGAREGSQLAPAQRSNKNSSGIFQRQAENEGKGGGLPLLGAAGARGCRSAPTPCTW